jgi:hypothetical protein
MKPYYVDDAVTIYHGRAEEVLPQLGTETVGLVVTSPPYNLGDMEGGLANLAGGYESYADQLPHGDYVRWQRDILTECWRVITNEGAIFYNHKPRIRDGILWTPLELNPGLPLRQIIIWARTIGVNWSETFFMPMHEWVMLFAKPGFRFSKSVSHHGDVWRMPPEPDRSHPAPFPGGLPSASRSKNATVRSPPVVAPKKCSGCPHDPLRPPPSRPSRRQAEPLPGLRGTSDHRRPAAHQHLARTAGAR